MILTIFSIFLFGCAMNKPESLDQLAISTLNSSVVGSGAGAIIGNQVGLTGEGALVGAAGGLISGLSLGSQIENLENRIVKAEKTLYHLETDQNMVREAIKSKWYDGDNKILENPPPDLNLELIDKSLGINEKEAIKIFSYIFKNLSYPAGIQITFFEPKTDGFNDQNLGTSIINLVISEFKLNGIDPSLIIKKETIADSGRKNPVLNIKIARYFPLHSVD